MSEYLDFEGLQQYHNSVKAALDTKVNKSDLLSYSEEVVMERDINNIETITKTEIIEYSEKEHIDYDGSELTKEITITRPCKLYLGFECKNSEQPSGKIPAPYTLDYEIQIGDTIYNSRKPFTTNKTSGDFEYVLLDITEDMLPYTTYIKIYPHMYANKPLKDLGQTIHLYSDIYYQGDSEIKSELLKGYVKEEDILTESEGYNANGHEYVDLGLPSGTLWSTENVSSNKVEHFAWGDPQEKSTFDWSTYPDNPSGDGQTFIKYKSEGKTELDLEDDPANVYWRGGWRSPSSEQLNELVESCTWTWKDNGYEVVGPNGNKIFLPADSNSESNYWSRSLLTSRSYYAYGLSFDSINFDGFYSYRYYGFFVRPVLEKSTTKKIKGELLPEVDVTNYVKPIADKVDNLVEAKQDKLNHYIEEERFADISYSDENYDGNLKVYGGGLDYTSLNKNTKTFYALKCGLEEFLGFNIIKPLDKKKYSLYIECDSGDIIAESENFLYNNKQVATIDDITDREWYGTQAEFDALTEYQEGVNYYIYD